MSAPFTAFYDLGYRWGYRFGARLAPRVPAPVVRWYGKRKGWL